MRLQAKMAQGITALNVKAQLDHAPKQQPQGRPSKNGNGLSKVVLKRK
jgi:hypothetical protein